LAGKSLRDIDCAISQTLAVVGEWWTLMILRNAFHGMRRFDAFQQDLGISTSVLAARLKTLTEAGILKRERSALDGRSYEYRLTEKGLDLYPLLIAMKDWGEKWCPSPDGARIELLEKATGRPVRGTAVLSQDGRVLDAREVRPVAGPGADPAMQRLLDCREQ
jgi:DNA-binding HxlR family transcriptional regulator